MTSGRGNSVIDSAGGGRLISVWRELSYKIEDKLEDGLEADRLV
jgi:hypothetical protein